MRKFYWECKCFPVLRQGKAHAFDDGMEREEVSEETDIMKG